jgi:protein-S-isoprenylcysteine O-methyltransferase Ste14
MTPSSAAAQARPWLSYTLVIVQFACLGYLVATGPWLARGAWLLVEASGLLLGAWALLSMRWSRLAVVPDPRPDVELVAHGPYRWVRHPMYAALLLVGLAWVGTLATPARWAVWGLLLVNLVVKLSYEERLLAAALPGYAAYRARTWRLLPRVF